MARPHYYVLNAAGQPESCEDVLDWARWFEVANRQVAEDLDEGDARRRVRVSTVFLGLDHNFHESGPPILWETLVFAEGDALRDFDGHMQRYASLEAAIRGHQDVCEFVMRRLRAARAEEPYQ